MILKTKTENGAYEILNGDFVRHHRNYYKWYGCLDYINLGTIASLS